MQQALTCVEICAGAGGQALGLAMAGFVHVALVEYEEDYCKVLKQNRPEWNVICADVHDFDGRPYHGVDLLAGGVPCPPSGILSRHAGGALPGGDDGGGARGPFGAHPHWYGRLFPLRDAESAMKTPPESYQ